MPSKKVVSSYLLDSLSRYSLYKSFSKIQKCINKAAVITNIMAIQKYITAEKYNLGIDTFVIIRTVNIMREETADP